MSGRSTPGTDEGPSTASGSRSKPRHVRFRWGEEIRKSDLPPLARLAALVLAEYIDKQGQCFVSNDRLATEMGYKTEKSAKDGKAILIERGWLRVVKQGGGAGNASVVEAIFPAKNQVAEYLVVDEEPDMSRTETGYATEKNRVPLYPPTEGQQKNEQNTTTVAADAVLDDPDEAEVRSMVAWMVVDDICKEIDGRGITNLPAPVRRESVALVAQVLEGCSVDAVREAMRPPAPVRNKAGLIRTMARGVAEHPPADDRKGESWDVAAW